MSEANADKHEVTRGKFVDRLIRSQLMLPEEIVEWESTLGGDVTSNSQAFARALVKEKKLTKFQAQAVYREESGD